MFLDDRQENLVSVLWFLVSVAWSHSYSPDTWQLLEAQWLSCVSPVVWTHQSWSYLGLKDTSTDAQFFGGTSRLLRWRMIPQKGRLQRGLGAILKSSTWLFCHLCQLCELRKAWGLWEQRRRDNTRTPSAHTTLQWWQRSSEGEFLCSRKGVPQPLRRPWWNRNWTLFIHNLHVAYHAHAQYDSIRHSVHLRVRTCYDYKTATSKKMANQLFIGRLPLGCRSGDVEDIFFRYGKMTRCDVKQGWLG